MGLWAANARLGAAARAYAGPVSAPEPDDEPGAPDSLWRRVRAQPERAPEHIALTAAERFGPAAERWVARMRTLHPDDDLAQVAVRKHVHMSRAEGLVTGAGGVITAVPDLLALAWLQSRMVFYIAAASGFDPNDPMRPAELLALQEVYATPAEARAALDGVGRHMAVALASSRFGRSGDQQLALRLLKMVGRRVAKRAALRVVPLLSAPVSAVQNGRATADLGSRAVRYYNG